MEATLKRLNDEVGGIVSTEGEVTAASTTADTRDPGNQQAVWKESGYWTYNPPPDNLNCDKHSARYVIFDEWGTFQLKFL